MIKIVILKPPLKNPIDLRKYKILCVKRERSVILLGDFLAKSNPNGKINGAIFFFL